MDAVEEGAWPQKGMRTTTGVMAAAAGATPADSLGGMEGGADEEEAGAGGATDEEGGAGVKVDGTNV